MQLKLYQKTVPEKSQGKVLQATIVALELGSKGKGGEIHPVCVKVEDKVLFLKYGGTKVVLDTRIISSLEMYTYLENM